MQGGSVGTHPPLGPTEGGSEIIKCCGCIALSQARPGAHSEPAPEPASEPEPAPEPELEAEGEISAEGGDYAAQPQAKFFGA